MNATHRFSYKDCHAVSALCPVSATVLGYYPNLGSAAFFAAAFFLLAAASLLLGVWKRTYTYCAGLTLGLFLEGAGHVGRAILHHNPWSQGAFDLQITAIILAPTFICVSIYLTLKHVAIALHAEASRLPPRWYPALFLPADLTCLVVQAVGGGVAAAAGKDNRRLQKDGNRAIIAGVALQVVVLLVFGALSIDYYARLRRFLSNPGSDSARALRTWSDRRFRKFVYAVVAAYLLILVRCIYRIAEMAGGWGNSIMQDQPSFLVLDSTLILLATFLLVVFHPGFLFPQMRNGRHKTDQGPVPVPEPGSSSEGTNAEKA